MTSCDVSLKHCFTRTCLRRCGRRHGNQLIAAYFAVKVFCFVLFFSRPRSEVWPHHGRTYSIYPCPLFSLSTGSPVHVLMLSIQAVRGLPRLREPGTVPCIISSSRQLPCFLMVRPWYASFLALTVSNSFLLTPTLLRTQSFHLKLNWCDLTLHANNTTYTHARLTAPFPGLPGWAATRKVKPIWILLKQESEWQWHQLGHMQVCISLQTDNHASNPPLSFFTGRMPFLPPNQQRQNTT